MVQACSEKREVTTSEEKKSSVLAPPRGQLKHCGVVCMSFVPLLQENTFAYVQ